MRYATTRGPDGPHAVRIDGDEAVLLGHPDLRSLLDSPGGLEAASRATGPRLALAEVAFAPLVPQPRKIICLGLNYRSHIAEMGMPPPEHPTIFAKYATSLVGAHDPIVIPSAAPDKVDYEAELAVVIGSRCRHVRRQDAASVIAGYTICNDVTARDLQLRTMQWLQGKTFDATTPLGPMLVTGDEVDHARDLKISLDVNGVEVQTASTSDLHFDTGAIIQFLSSIMTLEPGDVIATGTPGGVGVARTPQLFLMPGDVVRTSIEGLGSQRNVCVAEAEVTSR